MPRVTQDQRTRQDMTWYFGGEERCMRTSRMRKFSIYGAAYIMGFTAEMWKLVYMGPLVCRHAKLQSLADELKWDICVYVTMWACVFFFFFCKGVCQYGWVNRKLVAQWRSKIFREQRICIASPYLDPKIDAWWATRFVKSWWATYWRGGNQWHRMKSNL